MGASAREIALQCLLSCERQGAWSDGYLRAAMGKAGLDRRDAGLCAQLTFGVLQNRMLLDWHISRLSSTPVEKLEPAVRGCLRLGLYQLLLLDRVPVHAAVNESVTPRWSTPFCALLTGREPGGRNRRSCLSDTAIPNGWWTLFPMPFRQRSSRPFWPRTMLSL